MTGAGAEGAVPRDEAAADGGEAGAPAEAGPATTAGQEPADDAAASAPREDDAPADSQGQDAPPEDAGLDPDLLAAAVRLAEALVFASDRPVTAAMLGAILPEELTAGTVMAALAEACEGRGVVLAEVAGGWAFRTAPDLAARLTKVVQAPRRLPRAAMEALSIIAYHQPCTRGEIEEIRGAALAQTTLEALLELGLVAPRGRREVPGRPTLWGTTPKFLEQFALKALSDLPRKEELVTAETGPALPLGPAAAPGRAPPAAEPSAADASLASEPAVTERDDTPGAPGPAVEGSEETAAEPEPEAAEGEDTPPTPAP
ncbi:SMC-Scp complex subunit ScpB [Roseomonas terrae]|uniref:SMC-Scp complex subunit ScpB n=2 Tax=Neoroseomonas terrae TaxID=424799 RepID=A0ABS5EEL6_9PROT|nr:SMC-Scp complex subunit ScpB [Neoroseomonas terrae]